MSETRWSTFVWLGAWVVVAALQIAAVMSVQGDNWSMAAAAAVVQLLKIPISMPRLRDLGRPADDALWAMFPLLNVALFFQLMRPTPADELRERRVRSWSSQLSAAGAFQVGLGAMSKNAAVAVPTLLIAAAAAGLVEVGVSLIDGWMKAEDAQRLMYGDTAMLALGVVGMYTLVQIARRKSVSRASWVPSLAVFPLLLLTVAIIAAPSLATQAGLVIGGLPIMAADLFVWPLASGLLVGLWVRGARESLGAPGSDDTPTGGWGDITAVWGGRAQGVAIAAQFLFIPGIFLSIIWAFADIITVLRPSESAFAYSSRLARGVYNKLFKMLAVWFVVVVLLEIAVMSPWVDVWAVLQTLLGVPGLVPPSARAAAALARVFASWWFTMAVMAVFLERDGLFRALQERKAAEAAASA